MTRVITKFYNLFINLWAIIIYVHSCVCNCGLQNSNNNEINKNKIKLI